ncbi:hypothetical protein BC830DRAFT_369023 [Chytriomyces sp. MP71]|nr:hypothetical protein BC830DRAFT_369023 [Chytriomyces sp. MP71]
MINTHAHSQKQLAAKPQQSVRSRNTFASKNFDFEWNSLNRPASSAKDALVFGLKPSNAPTSEASDSFYFFKRSSRIQKNSVLVRAIQKKMKRMLSRQNLFMFNRDSLDTNSNIRDLYNSIPNISSSGIIAIWKVPSASNTSTSPNYVRVFKKLGKNNIADFVDNSGKYSGEHIFNLIVPTQAPSMLNKGSKFNNPNDEDDENGPRRFVNLSAKG